MLVSSHPSVMVQGLKFSKYIQIPLRRTLETGWKRALGHIHAHTNRSLMVGGPSIHQHTQVLTVEDDMKMTKFSRSGYRSFS